MVLCTTSRTRSSWLQVNRSQTTTCMNHPDSKDKVFLCVKSPQLNGALNAIREKLARERNHVFKEENATYYIRMTPEQAALVPKNQQINVEVNVYDVFYHVSSKNSFLQMELT